VATAIAIADEITAAGLRLAGVQTVVAAPADIPAAFESACRSAAFVLLTADSARHVPRARLAAALLGTAPLVAVIPDIEQRSIAPDVGAEMRRVLGVTA
jgi:vacuolar-type H+-ATPase subunit F/Vma7